MKYRILKVQDIHDCYYVIQCKLLGFIWMYYDVYGIFSSFSMSNAQKYKTELKAKAELEEIINPIEPQKIEVTVIHEVQSGV